MASFTSSVFLSLCLSLGSNISVTLTSNSSEVLEGEHIQLTCSVYSTVGALSIVWQWTDKDGSVPAVDLASVDRFGTVQPGSSYLERHSYGEVHVERIRSDTYTLTLYNAFPTDEGQYRCSATEWLQSGNAPDWEWQQIGENAATTAITVKSVGKKNYSGMLQIYSLELCLLISYAFYWEHRQY